MQPQVQKLFKKKNHFDKNTPKIYYTTPAILNSVCQIINAFSQCSQYFPRITKQAQEWDREYKVIVTAEKTLKKKKRNNKL